MSERTRLEAIRERATTWHHPCATYRPDCEDCRERWLLERVDELATIVADLCEPKRNGCEGCEALANLHAKETDQ